jgi:glyoxylase-like metal-dependent hydrolase (beta-lactamase superfamily II)
MILDSKGKISEDLYAIGGPELPAYLLLGKKPALFDAGMTFMGPAYLAELKQILTDPDRLDFNFLTHSHFDHSGATPYLKRHIPGLKIGASRLAAETFKKSNAVDLIRSLCRDYEEKYPELIGSEDVSFDAINVDIVLEDGAEVDLGGVVFRAIATPGHTRDSMTFHIPKLKAIITGEAVGVFDKNFTIHPEFLASYNDYLASLHKLAALDVEMIMMSHFFVLTGEEARGYMAKTIARTEEFRKRIENYLSDSNGDRSAVIKRIYKEDYEDTGAILQEVRPFLINLEAKVRAVAEGR